MIETVLFAELAWPQVASRIAAGAPIFLPIGATEQHGRHMAMNVDAVLPTAIAERVARRVGGLVAPTIPYGNRSQPKTGGGRAFPGTLDLTAATFSAVVRDVLLGLFRHGAQRIVVLNGHYENISPAIEAIELAFDAIGRDRADGLIVLRLDHWDLIAPGTIDRMFPDGYPGIELEHASVIETSMMLALRPELVDLAAAVDDGPAEFVRWERYGAPTPEVPASGVLSMTKGASAEKGEWLLHDIVEALVAAIEREFASNQRGPA
ncbi:MAG: creatininase [Ancalomicrobiaceae bacterium]|nr:creatininase [Ancalomicrobiaceae bacterium]